MDFSSCINFDDLEEKVMVAKPKITIKKQTTNNVMVKKVVVNEKYSERSKSFNYGENSIHVRPIINFPVFSKTAKDPKTRKNSKTYVEHLELNEKKTVKGNLGQLSIADENFSSVLGDKDHRRLNNKNIRRVKWHRSKLRSKSSLSTDIEFINSEKLCPGNDKKQISFRRKSISNNKPCIFQCKKQEKPELRIQGVSKDPEIKSKNFPEQFINLLSPK